MFGIIKSRCILLRSHFFHDVAFHKFVRYLKIEKLVCQHYQSSICTIDCRTRWHSCLYNSGGASGGQAGNRWWPERKEKVVNIVEGLGVVRGATEQ